MARISAGTSDRGRQAARPSEIPTAGWRDILLRVKDEISDDHVSITAAGVAFYGLLAIFPAIAALISIAALVIDPAEVEAQLAQITSGLPEDAASLLTDQAHNIASTAEGQASLAALFGIALALYSASAGVKTLMEGMNIAYDEGEERGFVRFQLTALVLTIVLIFGVLLALGAAVVLPAIIDAIGLGGTLGTVLEYGRWPVLALMAMLGLGILYRYGPSRADARWQWITPGTVIATVLWLIGSLAFSIYVQNFGSYDETYGSIGGVIILLMWFWVSAFIVLLGAELNAEMEHQTEHDTTAGPERPMGERGAEMADKVAPTR